VGKDDEEITPSGCAIATVVICIVAAVCFVVCAGGAGLGVKVFQWISRS
jgi:hypothetical protein